MVVEGELGKAARQLTPQAMAPPTAQTVEQLRGLHPVDATPLGADEQQQEAPAPLEVARSVFDRTLRHLPSFSGHGCDVGRFEHLRWLERTPGGG